MLLKLCEERGQSVLCLAPELCPAEQLLPQLLRGSQTLLEQESGGWRIDTCYWSLTPSSG